MISFPITRFVNPVIQELEDEVLICDTITYRAFCLNKTAAEVWKLCDGKKKSKQIAERLSEKFGKSVSEEVVWLALDQLSKDNLLQQDFRPCRLLAGCRDAK